MHVQVTAEQLVAAFQEHWPTQYEITALRLVNQAQGNRITDLISENDVMRSAVAASASEAASAAAPRVEAARAAAAEDDDEPAAVGYDIAASELEFAAQCSGDDEDEDEDEDDE